MGTQDRYTQLIQILGMVRWATLGCKGEKEQVERRQAIGREEGERRLVGESVA